MPAKKILFFLSTALLIVIAAFIPRGHHDDSRSLESGFTNPPDSIQTSVYWYWISDNISKEGVVRDLQSMKKAGINRAFIGNIGLSDVEYGKVKMLSEEWWEILHTALKTATELNIDIGIFNSPGWSQSGGPWVKAKDAMRYLISSEINIKGPTTISRVLDKPIDSFQDVRVIAYPAPKGYGLKIDAQRATISSIPQVSGLAMLFDGDRKTGISLPAVDSMVVNIDLEENFTARSLSVRPTEHPMLADIELQVKQGSGPFKALTRFELNRSRPDLNVGFEPYAPVVMTFPPAEGSSYRLIIKTQKRKAGNSFKEMYPESGIAEVEIFASPRLERAAEKSLAKMHPTPLPYWDA